MQIEGLKGFENILGLVAPILPLCGRNTVDIYNSETINMSLVMSGPNSYNENSGQVGLAISGFYKSGHIELYFDETRNKVVAYSRYNEVTDLDDFNDLVNLNILWWERGRERGFSDNVAWVSIIREHKGEHFSI